MDLAKDTEEDIWKTGIRSLSTVLLEICKTTASQIPDPKYEKLFPQIVLMPM